MGARTKATNARSERMTDQGAELHTSLTQSKLEDPRRGSFYRAQQNPIPRLAENVQNLSIMAYRGIDTKDRFRVLLILGINCILERCLPF